MSMSRFIQTALIFRRRDLEKLKHKFAAIVFSAILFATTAHSIGLRQVIRDCGPDGKVYCKGVGYGAPMQACLLKNRAKLTPICKAVVDRLAKGEKVRLFG
jgi:hypothetical protein